MNDYPPLPPQRAVRVTGTKYMDKEGRVCIWDGKIIKCEHNRERRLCKKCGGSDICEHDIRRMKCKKCDGSAICKHSRQRHQCKECHGSGICEHDRLRSSCRECHGASICEHDKVRATCRECHGASICEHDKQRSRCVECGGSQICEHNRYRSICKECGGTSICEHNRVRSICKECEGASVCDHGRRRTTCNVCDPNGYVTMIMRARVYKAIKYFSTRQDKEHTYEYIGCTVEDLRTHLELQLTDGMTRENQGEWHIDHIRPCASFDLDVEEERHRCFHYTNLQPLWGAENMSKSDTYDEAADDRTWTGREVGWVRVTPLDT